MLELPHTHNCLVCGRANPHGLHLALHVDPASSAVRTRITPTQDHIGFEGIIHGGLLATILDEAMVWAATYAGRRFCVCAEMTVRFRQSAGVGDELCITAAVDSARSKLITTTGEVRKADGTLLATATGKYIPVPADQHAHFVATLVDDPATADAAAMLRPT